MRRGRRGEVEMAGGKCAKDDQPKTTGEQRDATARAGTDTDLKIRFHKPRLQYSSMLSSKPRSAGAGKLNFTL